MKQDERDEALGRALDAGVAGLDRDASGRAASDVRRRGSRRRAVRWTASVALVSLFVATFAYLGFQTRHREVSLDTSTWDSFTDPNFGWTLRHPEAWALHYEVAGPEFEGYWGALVSNVDFLPPPHLPNSTGWDMRSLPPDGVVIEMARHGYLASSGRKGDSTFPLSLSEAEPVDHQAVPDQPDQYVLYLQVDGEPQYRLHLWLGDDLRPRDRRIVELIVESIRFPGVPVWEHHETESPLGSFDAPDTWTVEHRQEGDACWGRSIYLISNIPADIHHSPLETGSSCTTRWNYKELPGDLVFVEFATPPEGPSPPIGPPPSSFADLEPVHDGRFEGGWYHGRTSTQHYWVSVRWGPDSTEEDRRVAEDILASIQVEGAIDPDEVGTALAPYAHPIYPWSFEYPRGWALREGTLACKQTITSVSLTSPPGNSNLGYTMGGCIQPMIGLNSEVVEVRIEHRVEGPAPPSGPSRADTTFPLSIDDAPGQDASGYGALHVIPVWRNGAADTRVVVFIGEDAPDGEVERAREVLASLRIGPSDPPVERPVLEGNGFEVTYPVAWNAWTEGVDCKVSSRWLVVSSRGDLDDTHRYVIDGEDCEFRLQRQVAFDAVIVELVHRVTDAEGLDDVPPRPLRFEDAIEVAPGPFDGRVYQLDIVASDHASFSLRVFIGAGATDWQVEQVDAVLGSLTIEPWA